MKQNNSMLSSLLSYSDKKQALAELKEQVGNQFDSQHPAVFSLPKEIELLEKRLKTAQADISRLEKALAGEPRFIPAKSTDSDES